MPKFKLHVDVTQKGAIFDAAGTRAAAAKMVASINYQLATEAVRRIQARLKTVLQNPHGYYQSHVVVDNSTKNTATDSNVVYGGWLEGVTSRNQATRFKGYHTFRAVQQSIEADKVKLAQPAVDQFIKEMNG